MEREGRRAPYLSAGAALGPRALDSMSPADRVQDFGVVDRVVLRCTL